MYLFLTSNDCLDSHPNNHAWDFTTDLKTYVPLVGRWECALMDIRYTGKNEELYVYTDLCQSSYVSDSYLPILRIISNSTSTFTNPYFIPTSLDYVNQIRVYIRTKEGNIPSFTPKHLRCTLQIQHVGD